MMPQKREVVIYKTRNGKEPFAEWRDKLDKRVRYKIVARLNSIQEGSFGDYRFLGNGVSELKFREGVRVYYAEIQRVVILLLCGGNKNTKGDQSRDIEKAKEYLKDYVERENEK
jgi:putative addiction module killer protein